MFRSEEGEREPANVETDIEESEDKAPYVFPRGVPAPAPAASPVGRTIK